LKSLYRQPFSRPKIYKIGPAISIYESFGDGAGSGSGLTSRKNWQAPFAARCSASSVEEIKKGSRFDDEDKKDTKSQGRPLGPALPKFQIPSADAGAVRKPSAVFLFRPI
jgi:hypothetical protein